MTQHNLLQKKKEENHTVWNDLDRHSEKKILFGLSFKHLIKRFKSKTNLHLHFTIAGKEDN